MVILLFLLSLTFGLILPLILIFFVLFGLYTEILGAPFVPTSAKIIDQILAEAKLKKGQVLIELGSGDGRVLREAVRKFEVKAIGIEIHPILVLYSRLVAKIFKLKNIVFIRQNFFQTNLKKADVLFLFLLPKTLKKLAPKILKECKVNTLIISHGFKIEGFEKLLNKKIDRNPFPTYYYRMKKL